MITVVLFQFGGTVVSVGPFSWGGLREDSENRFKKTVCLNITYRGSEVQTKENRTFNSKRKIRELTIILGQACLLSLLVQNNDR
ncbi:hypothetical protein SLA2020_205830 [Shorea laevis]